MEFTLPLSLLEDLCAAPGVSGFEAPAAQRIQAYLGAHHVDCQIDRVGNLVARLPGEGPRVLLVAHMDEVGFIVRKVEAAGFLRLERIGGSAVYAMPGQHLLFYGETGLVPGVVGMTPPHLSGSTPEGIAAIYVDAGARSAEEALALGLDVGTPAVYQPRFQQLQGCVAAKALDDRGGCALLAQLAVLLAGKRLPCDLTLAFVVQEENVLTGARPVAAATGPDWVLGVDATLTYDTPDLSAQYADLSLGKGPAIKIMDHIRGRGQGLVAHPALRKHLEAVAARAGIALQREVAVGISTAVSPLPFTASGIPTAAVSFPLRYSHSPAEVASMGDLNQTLALLHHIVMDPWTG